jgi:uncharacterized membrane protein YphA (DoxX/SURF4 family)
LLTRHHPGHAFFLTGRGKLANFDNTVEFFASQNIPFPALNAAFVSRLEYYGGICSCSGCSRASSPRCWPRRWWSRS